MDSWVAVLCIDKVSRHVVVLVAFDGVSCSLATVDSNDGTLPHAASLAECLTLQLIGVERSNGLTASNF